MKRHLIFLCASSLVFTFAYTKNILADCASQAEIPKEECIALVDIYNSTDGTNWTKNTGWTANDKPCTWHGVVCIDGHVEKLQLLSENNLNGSLPPTIGNLTKLKVLELYDNNISGVIPPEIGKMTHLWSFDIKNNHLSGTIPPELGSLTNLKYLYLDHNQLSGNIPPELGNLTTKLGHLWLDHNQLSGAVPLSVAELSFRVYECYLDNNPDLCIPNTASYQALKKDPICGLPLSDDCNP